MTTGSSGTSGSASALTRLIANVSADEAAVLTRWSRRGRDGAVLGDALRLDGEAGTRDGNNDTSARPRDDDPRAVRRIGVIGGGTAGYFTALALRAKCPWLDVTLVESKTIPIIGVGEATTPSMIPFLHHYLGIDPAELYRAVAPTWKLGIRFDWGSDPDGFMAPFDWSLNSIGLLGSLQSQGNINSFTLQSLLMQRDRVPIFRGDDGAPVSFMKRLPFAYHLDNGRFVAFLGRLADERGVRHVDATVAAAALDERGWIDYLTTTDGERLAFDLYVDCSGFRSLLLENALGVPYESFEDSLWTDRAVTAVVPHNGHIKPYTRATTMDAGWCWSIPTRDTDHVGYVHSSRYLDEDAAADELLHLYPTGTDLRTVRFRSGRHERIWEKNVFAVGNSYAFVEPLESSGLLMICLAITALVAALPGSWDGPAPRAVVNSGLAKKWDEIRWFLALHYRFNQRKDTSFWKDVRADVDVSGAQPVLDVFAGGAPLRFRDTVLRSFIDESAPTFFGVGGIDCILLGQQYPSRHLPTLEGQDAWAERKAAANVLVNRAMHAAEALALFDSDMELTRELLRDSDSWVHAMSLDH